MKTLRILGVYLVLQFMGATLLAQDISWTEEQSDSIYNAVPFSVDSTNITHWNGERYVPVFLKGVNLGVSVPGTFPGQLAATEDDYRQWFTQMHEAGFNTIRVYTLHYPRFFTLLDSFNTAHPANPLYFFQGVWLEEEIPNYDQDLLSLDPYFTAEIQANVKAVHGDTIIPQRFGKAYGDFTTDASKWCMGYIIGREIYPEEVLITDANNPTLTSHSGKHLSINNATPAAAWMTSKLDYLIEWEWEHYGTTKPVSSSSWPTLDPMYHPYEQNRMEDTTSMDLSAIEFTDAPAGYFASYHAYPYYPDFMNSSPTYAQAHDGYGFNSYMGYLEDLKSHYKRFPLIIAEYGTPSSWLAAHFARSGMDHGGMDQFTQGFNDVRMIKNIYQTDCGGGFLFAWIDEWFKRTWIVDPLDAVADRRILWQNILSAEQNFGMLEYYDTTRTWSVWENFTPADEINTLEVASDYAYVDLKFNIRDPFVEGDTMLIGFDTYAPSLGESRLPNGDTVDSRIEFTLQITEGTAQLYVIRPYDTYAIWHKERDPDQLYRSIATDNGNWRLVRYKNNYGPQDDQYVGNLRMRREFQPASSSDAVVLDTNWISIRIPWLLLNYTDPSELKVLHDDLSTTNTHEDTVSDGIRVFINLRGQTYSTSSRYAWASWQDCRNAASRPKASFEYIANEWPNIPGGTVPYVDRYEVADVLEFSVDSASGLLSNDVQMAGKFMTPYIVRPPNKGFIQVQPNGAFTYWPDRGAYGTDTLEYIINTTYGSSESGFAYFSLSGQPLEVTPLLEAYPNPTSKSLTLQAIRNMDQIEVMNTSGAVIESISPDAESYELSMSHLPSGTYLLRITMGTDVLIRRIVKI
ncbi:MAG: hypothetical protein SchgKO_21990 [Schleiferiaceae bacterium]